MLTEEELAGAPVGPPLTFAQWSATVPETEKGEKIRARFQAEFGDSLELTLPALRKSLWSGINILTYPGKSGFADQWRPFKAYLKLCNFANDVSCEAARVEQHQALKEAKEACREQQPDCYQDAAKVINDAYMTATGKHHRAIDELRARILLRFFSTISQDTHEHTTET